MLTGLMIEYYPVGIYLLKVNNRNTRTRCEICRSFVNFSKALFKNFFRAHPSECFFVPYHLISLV